MDLKLKDKVAVVFASSKGLGKGAALALASEGCKVAVCSRDGDLIEQAASDIREQTGSEVFYQAVDVEHKEQIDHFIYAVGKKFSAIDILITNAGGPPVANFEKTTDEEWLKWYNITFMSVVRSVRAALPFLKQSASGRIINITSSSVKSSIDNLIYSNSLRLAVVGLAKSLSRELGQYGITVHNVAPGYHMTNGLERIIKAKVEEGMRREEVLKGWTNNVPVGRIGKPQDLAALITFLASGLTGYMSGTTIQVDGGTFIGTM